ncbi:uncharacterized protein LOC130767482 isoform X2 [Actinidia eriantha]|uniref:uncharacterized protein LOC130767482 isoform X2 n=1 Tax=Actinidia eriantha TaxID=165200 RepID=UPI002589F53F|nr:uncharacterized protein LOC130767482 isoform X2 [Actinidia eriantha]
MLFWDYMEVQKLQMQIFLLVGIQLAFLAGIGSCIHTSIASNEGGKYNSNSDFKTFSSYEKYITELYFKKHDSLLDSDFKSFIANELALGSCGVLQDKLNIAPRLSVLQRYLIGEGSHRRISSSIRLSIQPESTPELPRPLCKIIILARLPSGIFADPFELQQLLQRGVFTDTVVFGDTNLELPSIVSNRSVVEVHVDVGGPNILSEDGNGLELNIELPLHPLGELGFSRVEFGEPDLFMHCSIEEEAHNQSCLFVQTGSGDESRTDIVWEVPCGIEEHSGVVSVVTFVSAAVSALFIVLAAIHYSDVQKSALI